MLTKKNVVGVAAFGLLIGGFLAVDYFLPGRLIVNTEETKIKEALKEKSMTERIRDAEEKSQRVKGVYMTSSVANDRGRPATHLRNEIIELLDTTELNGVVIDVKETTGGLMITPALKDLVQELHRKDIWVIARLVVFKDDSQEKIHPEWYLKRKPLETSNSEDSTIWRDNRRGSWLDPASREVWDYQLESAKAASDAGFDEIQFDYIRFPSDGNVTAIVWPSYNGVQPKYEVLREFFEFMHTRLKQYRPDLILSADFFGYVTIQKHDLGIGQRLEDIGSAFDYISPMIYPSHYYAGFQIGPDPLYNLPALYFPYQSQDIVEVAVNHPYEVVYRSLLFARNVLENRMATATVKTTTQPSSMPTVVVGPTIVTPRVHLRPWLQDFDLGIDTARGIVYDAAKVRDQIRAAEDAGASGWLLWSAENTYTREALRSE